jgi:sugar O-acyltransferase (sialic acid O-acetyltransferase NeuD family)
VSLPSIVIYGATGQGRGVAYTVRDHYRTADIAAFIDDFDGDKGLVVDGLPLITLETWKTLEPRPVFFVASGAPPLRRKLAAKLREAGGELVDASAMIRHYHPGVCVGLGTLIATPVYIGPNTTLGENIQVMPMCSIAHDVIIGDNSLLCPSATISGHVVIEEGVFIGAGCTITNGRPNRPIVIGKGATIGTGAVVMRSVPPGVTVLGNPAVPLRELVRQRRG